MVWLGSTGMKVEKGMKGIRSARNPELLILLNLLFDLRMDVVAYRLGSPSLHGACRVYLRPTVTASTQSLGKSCRGRYVGQAGI